MGIAALHQVAPPAASERGGAAATAAVAEVSGTPDRAQLWLALKHAISQEDYERAAQLRDAIKRLDDDDP